jgi:hypothetical protein
VGFFLKCPVSCVSSLCGVSLKICGMESITGYLKIFLKVKKGFVVLRQIRVALFPCDFENFI